jgi:HicB family
MAGARPDAITIVIGFTVRNRKKERINFPLRLAKALKDRARLLATQEGVSLNHFISSAVGEKITRLEAVAVIEGSTLVEREMEQIPFSEKNES